MSKRNIAYIKPKDPSFLAKLKAEIGYKEGPTVDTKRQKLQDDDVDCDSSEESSQRPEREDEQPQVVVLEAGDLTEEEVDRERQRIAREEAEAPADLKKRIIFKKKSHTEQHSGTAAKNSANENKKKKKKKNNRNLQFSSHKLSFSEKDDEEEDDQ